MNDAFGLTGIALCVSAVVFGALAWLLGLQQDAGGVVAGSAALGGLVVVVLVVLNWQDSLESAGYYGVRRQLEPNRRSSPKRARAARTSRIGWTLLVGAVPLVLAATGINGLVLVGCVFAFGAGMALVAAVLFFGLRAATELKWRRRDRD